MGELSNPTVAVFDYNWSGHIPAYHRLIVESLLNTGWQVISLSGHHDEIREHVRQRIPDALPKLVCPVCPGLGRPPARNHRLAFLGRLPGGHAVWSRVRTNATLRERHALARWTACQAALDDLPPPLAPQIVLFPYLDDMLEPTLTPAAIRFETPWIGLHVSASELRDPQHAPTMKERFRLLQHPCNRGLLVLDAHVMEMVRSMAPGRVVATLPDIADGALAERGCPLAREVRERAGGRRIIALLGHLSVAKNLELFLQLATAPENEDLFFLLAGQFEPLGVPPRLRRQIEAAAGGRWQNIWAIPNRIASEGEFNRLLQDSDVVFAIYRSFPRSSNILSKAALFRRPVVVAEGYCMAERTVEYNLGLAVLENDPPATVAAIRRLLATPTTADYERFARDFSHEEFERRLDLALREALVTISPHV